MKHAIGGDHQLTTGIQATTISHSHTIFGGQDVDAVGVHAAERAGINGQDRLGSCASGRSQCACEPVDVLRAGHQIDFLAVEPAGDDGGPSQDFGVGRIAVVQAIALHEHSAFTHGDAGQLPVEHIGCARGEHRAAGVDKAGAVHHQATGIGHNHLSGGTVDGNGASQIAGVGGVHLVENDLGLTCCKPRVAGAAVVKHHTVAAHIELAIGVAADTTSAWRLDVNQRPASAVHQHSRPLIGGGVGVGHDLGHCRTDGTHPNPSCQGCSSHGGPAPRCLTGGGRRGALTRRVPMAVCAGGFSHRHELPTGAVENDAIAVLVHT